MLPLLVLHNNQSSESNCAFKYHSLVVRDIQFCELSVILCCTLIIAFVTVMPVLLHLQEFRSAVEEANKSLGRPVVPGAVVDQIICYLPQLQQLNEELLADLKGRLDNWYYQL